MIQEMKRLIVGKPLSTEQQSHERLNKTTALAVFSSDALSSVAYASEAILSILILAGAAALTLSIPIALGIALLLVVVAISYRQTIHAYPNGGGAYIVARENLGKIPGLTAAAALLIDYVLTVAVSISAGVAAITSLAGNWGMSGLKEHAVLLGLICIAIITLANLRGVKESGTLFAIPTYVFIISILLMLLAGILTTLFGHPARLEPGGEVAHGHMPEAMGLWLVLRAFAAGCTALTGVEAISNGIPAFKQPEAKNAATTLTWMVGLLTTMFLGITWLAHTYGAVPNELTHETVVSQIARSVFGVGPVYVVIQVATALILVLAANTAYADFPRLASLLAHDRYLPRQFSSRGDRLVFSNGIVALGFFAALLVMLFQANEIAMLPLYAIGVFISFTLSQGGMILHHLRLHEQGWRRGIAINGFGALLTAVVLVVLVLTRFTHGAWVVIVLLPLIVGGFLAVYRHYTHVAEQLSLAGAAIYAAPQQHTAVVLVSGIHRGVIPALQYARSIAGANVTAVYVNLDPVQTEKIKVRWAIWGCSVPLVVLESPYRSLLTPLLSYIEELNRRHNEDFLTVVLPEFVPAHWWEHLLHNQTGLLIKTSLMYRRGTVVTSVPYQLER